MRGSLDDYPRLPLPPAQLFCNANALKGYVAKQLSWLLEPLKLKRGEGVFSGWNYEVDKARLIYSGAEVAKLPSQTVSLSMLIDWVDMRHMTSLSRGNAKALKEGTGVTKWVPFCKVVCEIIFLMIEEEPSDWYQTEKEKKSVATKKVVKSKKVENPFVDSDSDFEPFTQKTPPRLNKVKTLKERRKANVVSRLKKPELVREGGADDDLHLGLALSISAEEVIKTKRIKKQTNKQKITNIIHCLKTNMFKN